MPTDVVNNVNREVVKWCAVDFRPLSAACSSSFGKVAQTFVDLGAKFGSVDAKSVILDSSRFSRRLLPTMYNECIEAIGVELVAQCDLLPAKLPPFALVGDHWKCSVTNVDYTGIGVSYITKDFSPKSRVLCVQPYSESSKHAEKIKKDIQGKLKLVLPIINEDDNDLVVNIPFISDRYASNL